MGVAGHGRESYARALLQTVGFPVQAVGFIRPHGQPLWPSRFFEKETCHGDRGGLSRVVSDSGVASCSWPWQSPCCRFKPAGAARAPSLDEIKAGLKQRREKIESLYLETVGETLSPADERGNRPPAQGLRRENIRRPQSRDHYAAKGDSRFSRVLENGKDDGLWDHARGDNGKYLWDRFAYPNSKGDVQVTLLPPSASGHLRFIYPNPWLALVVGEAIVGPNPWATPAVAGPLLL